jgi:hypothetical protein
MELNDKLQREAEMLKKLVEADEEDKKQVNNDYFAKTKSMSSDTAFEDMKGESLSEVSAKILKKAHKNWFRGLMPGSEFLGMSAN